MDKPAIDEVLMQTTGNSENDLLARMGEGTAEQFFRRSTLVDLSMREVLHRQHVTQDQLYFPTEGAVSMLLTMASGKSAEVGIVGRDGFVGVAALLEATSASSTAMVQIEGRAWRIATKRFQEIAHADPAFMRVLLRYVQFVVTQTSQTAICNRHHTLLQQFSRWILHMTDLSGSREVAMTQQLVAEMLGTRREAVSVVESSLQSVGIIAIRRGGIEVRNRDGLSRVACECYRILAAERERLLPGPRRRR